MGKKRWIIVASIAVSLIFIFLAGSYLYFQIVPFCCKYEITVEKSYNTSLELQAINVSEDLDIASILHTKRYTDWDHNFSDPPKRKTAYVWPNIIDNTSLTYYREKIERLEESKIRVLSEYSYAVKAEHIKDYSFKVQNMSIYIQSIILYDFSSCAVLIDKNLTMVTEDTGEVEISNISGYYIEQTFEYRETYAPLAGFGGEVKQIIILNDEFQPITVISVSVSVWIS